MENKGMNQYIGEIRKRKGHVFHYNECKNKKQKI